MNKNRFKFVQVDEQTPTNELGFLTPLEKEAVKKIAVPGLTIVMQGMYDTQRDHAETWVPFIELIDTLPIAQQYERNGGKVPTTSSLRNSIMGVAIPEECLQPDFEEEFLLPIEALLVLDSHDPQNRLHDFKVSFVLTAEVREILVNGYKEFRLRYTGGFYFNPHDDENE